MNLNGWLQITFFIATVLLLAKPMGSYMTAVFERRKTFLDPILRPCERLLYRITGIDPSEEMRWTQYAVAMLVFSAATLILTYVIERLQGYLPWNPQHLSGVESSLAFEYCDFLYDKYELAGIHAGIHHELSDSDAWTGDPQFLVSCGGHGPRYRLRAWYRSQRDEDDRQLLG